MLTRPDLWLRHRSAVFRELMSPSDVERCHTDFSGVDGPPQAMAQLGLRPGWRPQDLALARYAAGLHRTPLYSPLAMAVAAGLLAVAAARSRRADAAALAVPPLAALAFAGSFAVIGVACDHRYVYALDLAVLVTAFRLAVEAPRPAGPDPLPSQDAPP